MSLIVWCVVCAREHAGGISRIARRLQGMHALCGSMCGMGSCACAPRGCSACICCCTCRPMCCTVLRGSWHVCVARKPACRCVEGGLPAHHTRRPGCMPPRGSSGAGPEACSPTVHCAHANTLNRPSMAGRPGGLVGAHPLGL